MKYPNSFQIGLLTFFLFSFSIIGIAYFWNKEEKEAVYIDDWMEYEVIHGFNNEIMLYNHTLQDSIEIRVINPNCFLEPAVLINRPQKVYKHQILKP